LNKFQEKGVKLISIASDSKNHLTDLKQKHDIKIPLVSDRGAAIAKKFKLDWFSTGAGIEMKFKQAFPSKVLINKDKKIVWLFIGKDKDDRPSMEQIFDAIVNNL